MSQRVDQAATLSQSCARNSRSWKTVVASCEAIYVKTTSLLEVGIQRPGRWPVENGRSSARSECGHPNPKYYCRPSPLWCRRRISRTRCTRSLYYSNHPHAPVSHYVYLLASSAPKQIVVVREGRIFHLIPGRSKPLANGGACLIMDWSGSGLPIPWRLHAESS